ncbi:MAG: FHA domain-containing protein [Coriobacteriales bacterium]|jgi:hypothetical protein|nr:FHA domain-containing protein [Coriobacteriales bacterium]
MRLTRCANGHFYDEEKYDGCPHCGVGIRNDAVTVGAERNEGVTVPASVLTEDLPTSMFVTPNAQPLGRVIQQAVAGVSNTVNADDVQTIGFFQKRMGTEPVVGWLVATEGSHKGEDFRLKSGRNFIGRSAFMDVCLSKDDSVARERHAAVVFDPKAICFLVQAGDSKELFYVNDKVVLTVEELKPFDTIAIGETRLAFVPFCGKDFSWKVDEPAPTNSAQASFTDG